MSFAARVDEYTVGDEPKVLGVVTVAVNQHGQPIFSHAAGKTDLNAADAQPIDEDHILTLASCTKLTTTIATLRLVEQGKLALDDSSIVEKHLPELWRLPIITSRGDPPFEYEDRKNPITIRQLLTHTSGSSFDLIDPTLQAWRKSRGEALMSLSAALPEAIEMPSLFHPGEGWTYGGGTDWVGLLISRLTGSSLGEVMRKEIFDVLGCDERIGFSKTEVEKHGKLVECVTVTNHGTLAAHPNHPQKSERGGGGLFSSTRNFVKVLADLVSTKPKLLREDTISLLFAPQLGKQSALALAALQDIAPMFSAMTGPLTKNLSPDVLEHALGGILVQEDNPALGKTKDTMTWGGAFSCMWFANRERGVAGFYGSSMIPPGAGVSRELMGEFVKEVWQRVEN